MKMKTSGHTPAFIRSAAIRGISNYEQKVKRSNLDKSDPAFLPLYVGSFNSMGRNRSKAMSKKNWFKNKEDTA